MTQCSPEELDKLPPDQRHEPLAFLGSQFKKAELNWNMFEKEGSAIFQSFDELDYLLMSGRPANVFTDHRNLLFVFAPLALEPVLGPQGVSTVQRWALFLSKYTYVIEHIDGDDNVFADVLTRWTKGYRNEGYKLKTICSLLVQSAEQIVPAAEMIEWPDMENFRGSQAQDDGDQKIGLEFDAVDRIWKMNDRIWIPNADKQLQLKLMVVSHCGIMGHRDADATKSVLRENSFGMS